MNTNCILDHRIFVPILFFIIYLVSMYQYQYYNNIIDKLVGISLILYYSILDIRYGLVVCFIIIVYMNHFPRSINNSTENFEFMNVFDRIIGSNIPILNKSMDKSMDSHQIELVIARYNENLNWVNMDPFDKYPVYVYNKGPNDNYTVNNKNVRIQKLNNVGKCDHTYLYHIIENYDNLADVTVFLPGSVNMNYKIGKAKKIMSELKQKLGSVFIGNYMSNVKKHFYKFQLNDWKTTNKENYKENTEQKLQLSKIRPFGKWYENKFGDIQITHLSFGGIMAISKEHILQHSKQYYKDLIKDLDNSSNPEAGHYFERAWEAVFYPMNGANFIRGII